LHHRAADGIGFAVAEAMAEAGANLALWYNTNTAAISKGADLASTYASKSKPIKSTFQMHHEYKRPSTQWYKTSASWMFSLQMLEWLFPSRYLSRRWKNIESKCRSMLMVSSFAQVRRRGIQATRSRQPNHHLQHLGAHRQRSS